jgi:hypothetical protein
VFIGRLPLAEPIEDGARLHGGRHLACCCSDQLAGHLAPSQSRRLDHLGLVAEPEHPADQLDGAGDLHRELDAAGHPLGLLPGVPAPALDVACDASSKRIHTCSLALKYKANATPTTVTSTVSPESEKNVLIARPHFAAPQSKPAPTGPVQRQLELLGWFPHPQSV